MKRYLLRFSMFLAMIAMLFVIRNLYERQIPTDDSAALVLNKVSASEVGGTIVDCLNRQNHSSVWWDWNSMAVLRANYGPEGAWNSSYYIINGRTGWHVTWMTLVSYETDQITAYETFGANNNQDGAMFRRAMPTRVISALKRCGVIYDGIYPDELPFT